MIALQEQMIEELKAYKQSVITEAVTKGLNPHVPMRDSGIDWIGEIPEHWKEMRIKNVTSNYKAGPFGSALITGNLLHEGNILVYMPEHVADSSTIKQNPNNLFLQENRREEMSQFFIKTGDIVFPIVGSLGRAILIKEYMPEGIINQRLSKFSINRKIIDENYFMWLFGKSEFYAKYIEMNCRGSFIVNLTKSIVGDMPLPVPPLSEQRAIASYLDIKCSEIDSLIALKQAKIEELKEYKKSVIYEYVTGKKEVI
jgi:type I restriction enzyme S subunit